MVAVSYQNATAIPSDRIDFVDYAKGICILLVVMMHTTLGLGEAAHAMGWMHSVVEFARPFRMPDFFLVSGLFLARVIDRDWRTYLDRKVVHFLYFYLLWFGIQSLLRAPGLLAGGDPGALLRHLGLGLIDPFGTLWFIYILPIFFVVTKLLRRIPAPVLVGAAAALEIAHLQSDWTVPLEFARRYVFFVIGYLFAGQIFAFARKTAEHPGEALIGLIIWANLNGIAVWSGKADLPGLSLLLGLAGAAAIVAIAAILARFDAIPALRVMGEHSIVIYLSFFLPMVLMRTALLNLGLIGLDVGTASALITMVAALLPLAFYAATCNTPLRFLFERPAWAHLAEPKARLTAAG
jgi:uncharacterized membrane protein YcfT